MIRELIERIGLDKMAAEELELEELAQEELEKQARSKNVLNQMSKLHKNFKAKRRSLNQGDISPISTGEFYSRARLRARGRGRAAAADPTSPAGKRLIERGKSSRKISRQVEKRAELELLAEEKLAGFKLRIPDIGKAIGSLGKATKGGKIPPLSNLGARQASLNKSMDVAAKMRGQGAKSPAIDAAMAKVKQPKTLGQHVQDFLPFTTD